MHHLKFLNVRTLALAAVGAALLIAGSLSIGTADRASATDWDDPTGVFCGDIDVAAFNVSGISLTRFDNNWEGVPNQVAISTAQYVGDAGPPAEVTATCQDPGSAIGVPFVQQTTARPIIVGDWDAASRTLTGELCQEELQFTGATLPGWSKLEFEITFAKSGKTTQAEAFKLHINVNPGANPPDTCGSVANPIAADVEGKFVGDGEPGSAANLAHDWDGGGVSDWDELDPSLPQPRWIDPFNAKDDEFGFAVGGVAELPDERMTPLQTGDGSGTGTGLIIALASAGVAAVVATGGTAWALRRRFVR